MAETRDWASGLHSIGEGSADQAMAKYGYATPASIDAAIRALGSKVPESRLTDGTMLAVRKAGTSWPARPTTRTDVMVVWVGVEPAPPVGGTGMVTSMDIWWDLTERSATVVQDEATGRLYWGV